jgi:uncharacterized protein (TIGR00255 family)
MTGFGRAAFQVEGVTFQVEMRSVNHRHLDVQVRLPRLLAGQEAECRRRVQGAFGRGKLELSVSSAAGAPPPPDLEIDRAAAQRYVEAARTLASQHGLSEGLSAAALLALPGVSRLAEHTLPEGELAESLGAAVGRATAELAAMRESEGRALERELRLRLGRIEALLERLSGSTAGVQEVARERLRRRAEQLRAEVGHFDEARLHQEIVLAADRLDVAEEIARLRSHVEQFGSALAAEGEPVGRRLDFLLQEMGREANTLGAKAADAAVAHQVVDLKTELERVREQVQNVE